MQSANAPARTGRPRDPDVDRRIEEAAVALYYEEGWAGFSLDAVATRAGVGKSSIYLRTSSKEELLVAALRSRTAAITAVDTGSLRGDLLELATRQIEHYTAPYGLVTLRLIIEAPRHPALAERSRQRLDQHLAEGRSILGRAVARGELAPGAPDALVLSCVSGAVLNMVLARSEAGRLELREHARDHATSIVDLVLGAVVAAPGQVVSP
jgi:AcrR family transcriptional regulator